MQIFQGQIFPSLIFTKLVNSVLTEGLPEGQKSVAKGKVAKGIGGKKMSESMRSKVIWEHGRIWAG